MAALHVLQPDVPQARAAEGFKDRLPGGVGVGEIPLGELGADVGRRGVEGVGADARLLQLVDGDETPAGLEDPQPRSSPRLGISRTARPGFSSGRSARPQTIPERTPYRPMAVSSVMVILLLPYPTIREAPAQRRFVS